MKDTSTPKKTLTILTTLFLLTTTHFAQQNQETQQRQPQKITEEGLRADFASIDKNKDGFIDAHELRTAIPNINEDDITSFFDRYDSDRNAVITLEEYLMILHTEATSPPPESAVTRPAQTQKGMERKDSGVGEGRSTVADDGNEEEDIKTPKKKGKKGKKGKKKGKKAKKDAKTG